VTISPSGAGATAWAAKAYSPQTGLVYMPVNGFNSRTYIATEFELTSRATQFNGTPRGGVLPPGAPTPSIPPLIGPPQSLRGGFLVAFDPVTQKERWRNPGGGGSGGGALATASNLVFQVVNDGRLIVLRRSGWYETFRSFDRAIRHGSADYLRTRWPAVRFVSGRNRPGRSRRSCCATSHVHLRVGWKSGHAVGL